MLSWAYISLGKRSREGVRSEIGKTPATLNKQTRDNAEAVPVCLPELYYIVGRIGPNVTSSRK